jgi:hypothetical protein
MSTKSGANPYEVMNLRRKLKQYKKVGFSESMTNLQKLRQLGLDKEVLIAT